MHSPYLQTPAVVLLLLAFTGCGPEKRGRTEAAESDNQDASESLDAEPGLEQDGSFEWQAPDGGADPDTSTGDASPISTRPEGGWTSASYVAAERFSCEGVDTCEWYQHQLYDGTWQPSTRAAELILPERDGRTVVHLEGNRLYVCQHQLQISDLSARSQTTTRQCNAMFVVNRRLIVMGDGVAVYDLDADKEGRSREPLLIDTKLVSAAKRVGDHIYGVASDGYGTEFLSLDLSTRVPVLRTESTGTVGNLVALREDYAFVGTSTTTAEGSHEWHLRVLSPRRDLGTVEERSSLALSEAPYALDVQGDVLRVIWLRTDQVTLQTFAVGVDGVLTPLDRITHRPLQGALHQEYPEQVFDDDYAYVRLQASAEPSDSGLTTGLVAIDLRNPADLRATEITLPAHTMSLVPVQGRLIAASETGTGDSSAHLTLFDLATAAALSSVALPPEYTLGRAPALQGDQVLVPLRRFAEPHHSVCALGRSNVAALLGVGAGTTSAQPLGYLEASHGYGWFFGGSEAITTGARSTLSSPGEIQEVSRFSLSSSPFTAARPSQEWLHTVLGKTLKLESGLVVRSVDREGSVLELHADESSTSALSALSLSAALSEGDACAPQARVMGLYRVDAGGILVDYLRFERMADGYKELRGLALLQVRDGNRLALIKATPPTPDTGEESWHVRVRDGVAMHAITQGAFVGYEYSSRFQSSDSATLRLRVVDVRLDTPTSQTFISLPIPAHRSKSGFSGLFAAGNLVIFGHAEPTDDPRRVRYLLQRLDVSDPSAPRLLSPLSMPGMLVGQTSDSLLRTVDFQLEKTIPSGDRPNDCSLYAFTTSRASSEPYGTQGCDVHQGFEHDVEVTSSGVEIRSTRPLPLLRQ